MFLDNYNEVIIDFSRVLNCDISNLVVNINYNYRIIWWFRKLNYIFFSYFFGLVLFFKF